ncbi:type VI secretion system lipoprotein TssJ [Pseudomonas sp. S75]|uniref:type VI secretion system lipoprotein TssJ n=1 Tax=unclassified Pseudomonas TaxID=196821 RepID=UPI0019046634|nr:MULTISPECIES: type VI secretion system lipoprotein TssJ [unclassified Pseudomonas]MBJ9978454.1 type VI secretion system lipoprotein TssJ [Pseudomonas sp. S30]MBK0156425.1 type VI secretion system lipoprotein TssJ [Pseudomonas sp. S75]
MTRHSLVLGLLATLIGLSGCTALSKMGQVAMNPSMPIGAIKDQPTEIAFSINASPTLNSNPNSLQAEIEQTSRLEPSPYAVSLSASDPYALTEKVGTLLEFLHEQFPPASAAEPFEGDIDEPTRSPLEESTPGHYEDSNVMLTLPRATAATPEPIATPMAIKILQLRDDSLLRNSLYELLDKDPAKALRSTYIRDDDYLLRPGQFKFIPFAAIEAETRFIAVIADYRNQDDATWSQVLRIPPRGQRIILSVLLNDKQILLKEED